MVDVEENIKLIVLKQYFFSDTVSIFVKHLQISNNTIMVNRIGQNHERNSQSRGHSPYKKSKLGSFMSMINHNREMYII